MCCTLFSQTFHLVTDNISIAVNEFYKPLSVEMKMLHAHDAHDPQPKIELVLHSFFKTIGS